MSLNKYHPQCNEEVDPKKKGMIELETHDALLSSNKLLSIQIETISKKLLDPMELA
jgi:hypothetical protein